MEKLMLYRPKDERAPRGVQRTVTRQMSYNDGQGKQQLCLVVPPREWERLKAWSSARGRSMSETIREAVFDLARRMGILEPTEAELLAQQLAAELGVTVEKLNVDLDGHKFRPTLEALARLGGPLSLSMTVRWALNVYIGEQ